MLEKHDVQVNVEKVHFFHLEEDFNQELSLIVFEILLVDD